MRWVCAPRGLRRTTSIYDHSGGTVTPSRHSNHPITKPSYTLFFVPPSHQLLSTNTTLLYLPFSYVTSFFISLLLHVLIFINPSWSSLSNCYSVFILNWRQSTRIMGRYILEYFIIFLRLLYDWSHYTDKFSFLVCFEFIYQYNFYLLPFIFIHKSQNRRQGGEFGSVTDFQTRNPGLIPARKFTSY